MRFIWPSLKTSLFVSTIEECPEYDQRKENKQKKNHFISFFHTPFPDSDTSKAPLCTLGTSLLTSGIFQEGYQWEFLSVCSIHYLVFSNLCRLWYGHKMWFGVHSSRSCKAITPRKWASDGLKNASSEATQQLMDSIFFWQWSAEAAVLSQLL